MGLIVKLVEKKVRDKKRGKVYTSVMVTIPKPIVKAWRDASYVLMELDKRGRLILTPLSGQVAEIYGGRRAEV